MALQKDVCVGQIWIAKVSQKLTEVEILYCKEGRLSTFYSNKARDRWGVKNLKTGRIVEMTAAKLRRLVSHSTIAAPKDVETAALDILKKMGG